MWIRTRLWGWALGRVKFRRWGPYVWWICPSRKCSFENKTDLSFVKGEYQTKCQYCNTPITIKMNAGQLDLESIGIEEEEAKPSPTPAAPKTPAVTLTPQAPSTSGAPATQPPSSSSQQNTTSPSPSPAPTNNPPSVKQMASTPKEDSGSENQKEPKKKAS